MSDVSLSKAVRSNLLHLQNTAKMMDITQERLATGLKVNSALDNPTNFFTAASLNGRAADIGTLLDAMGNGIKVIEAADNGLTAITKQIELMQSTLRQARQDKNFQTISLPMAATRSGELTLTGGGFPNGDTISIPLTNAIPASVTAGADLALEGSQGVASFSFTEADFAASDDVITFNLNIDGVTLPVEINSTIAAAVTAGGDGNIDTGAEFKAALEAAIVAAGFDASAFEVEVTGAGPYGIAIGSTSRGPDSQVGITSPNATGTSAIDIADTGLDTITDASAGPQTAEFTIDYGGATLNITLNGDDHPDVATAIQHINDEIAAYNANPANAAAPIDVTASASGGRVVLRGPADGSGPAISVYDVTAGSTDAVFGTSGQRDVTPPSPANGEPKTVDQLVRDINANPAFKNIIRASNDNGRLRIENLSTKELDVVGLTNGALSGGIGTAQIAANDSRGSLARTFNELRTELDRLVDDASFNGLNLLRGDQLKIVFNESGTSTIEIQTKNAKGEPWAVNATNLNIRELTAEDFNLDESIDKLLADMQVTLNEVRSQASSLGSTLSVVQNRENFTKQMINTLETGAANLTLADTNEEAANMLALQTRQQLSQTALSLASQADQAVLRLFG